jgi:phospholipid/cholesterol/gamma-HCH transport system substrate-binding protein
VTVKYLKGIEQVLVIFPYVVAGGFTVTKKNRDGRYDAQFGFILTEEPKVCEAGYVKRRTPQQTSDKPMVTTAGCDEGGTNLRGAEKSPRGNAAAANRPPVATYDERTGKVIWADQDTSPKIAYDGGAAQLYGADSWKSMLLQPSLADTQE